MIIITLQVSVQLSLSSAELVMVPYVTPLHVIHCLTSHDRDQMAIFGIELNTRQVHLTTGREQ